MWAMSERKCQWCGAGVNTECKNEAGETVLYLFRCQTSQWAVGPWHIGNQCRERCAEQIRRLRAMPFVAVQIDSVTEGG